MRPELAQVLNTVRVMHQRNHYLVTGHVSEGFVRLEVADPQITQSDEPERVVVNGQDSCLVLQDADSAGLQAPYHLTQQGPASVDGQTRKTIIVITQARIPTKSAFDIAQQSDNLLPVLASNIVSNVIARQHYDIDIKSIDSLNAAM
jgi:hypothetical protein